MTKLLNLAEVAARLRLSKSTIYRLLAENRFPDAVGQRTQTTGHVFRHVRTLSGQFCSLVLTDWLTDKSPTDSGHGQGGL